MLPSKFKMLHSNAVGRVFYNNNSTIHGLRG